MQQQRTISSAVREQFLDNVEGKRMTLHKALSNLEKNFDGCVFEPDTRTQVIIAASQHETENSSKVCELELENRRLQKRLKEKEEEYVQLQKQLEKEQLAAKVLSEEEKQKITSNTFVHEQKVVEMQRTIDTLTGQNQELILSHEVTVNQFTSKIKELEEALKKSTEKMGQAAQNEKVHMTMTNKREAEDHAEKQRLHQEMECLKSLTTRLQQENKQLKDSLQIQEQQTTNGSRQGQLKKKSRRTSGRNQAGAVVKRTVDQACQSEQSVLELNEVKAAHQKLQEQLNREKRSKWHFKNELDAFHHEYSLMREENNKLHAVTNNCVHENKNLKDDIQRLEAKSRRETDMLHKLLKKEQQKSSHFQTSINKRDHEVSQQKEALENVVENLKLKLNQETEEKEKQQNEVRKLELTLEKERGAFKDTIRKCYAAYQEVAAKAQ
ncbi:hypothetical protein WMY93_001262 [Mugilogobius chulae]|uniref:CCDC144C-like coiled-coil domain-containing protein n=1 Tax=Mugilogobius chulae TaxID=88201 RepID=A0AAW0Q1S0_9GOBI